MCEGKGGARVGSHLLRMCNNDLHCKERCLAVIQLQPPIIYEVISKTNYNHQIAQKPKDLQQNLFSNFFFVCPH
jgi:hypothetical protein